MLCLVHVKVYHVWYMCYYQCHILCYTFRVAFANLEITDTCLDSPLSVWPLFHIHLCQFQVVVKHLQSHLSNWPLLFTLSNSSLQFSHSVTLLRFITVSLFRISYTFRFIFSHFCDSYSLTKLCLSSQLSSFMSLS